MAQAIDSNVLASAQMRLRFPILLLWPILLFSFVHQGFSSDNATSETNVVSKALKTLKIGDLAPGFEVRTLENNYVSLAEYKGKYVLLNFWATSCPECLVQTPYVRAAYYAADGDSRFTCISLCLDATKDAALKYVAEKRLEWPQGFLGDWAKATLPADYGIQKIPSIWLIGPDGKVVSKELRGNAIKAMVEKVLAR